MTSSIERVMEQAGELGVRPALAPAQPVGNLTGRTAGRSTEAPQVTLDFAYLREQGYLTPEDGNRALQEQYRMVKRPLLGHAFSGEGIGPNPANLIQVTSSIEGEGKTFTAMNLGMSIAMEVDFTVVLLDADLTRRSLTHLVGLEDHPGLTDLLVSDRLDLSEVLYSTNVPRVRVVPAGTGHPRSTELIASDAMRRVTRELAQRYPDRIVIFDSPPLLMDSQAATLSSHVGQLLIVVEAGRTVEKQLKEALGHVDQTGTRTGLLLNKSSRGYGSGYYYGGY